MIIICLNYFIYFYPSTLFVVFSVNPPLGFLIPDQVHANREHRYTTVQPLATEGTRYSRHRSTPISCYLIPALVCPRQGLPNADLEEVGIVEKIGDGIATVIGMKNAMAGELVELPHNVSGMVLNLPDIPVYLLEQDIQVLEYLTSLEYQIFQYELHH